MSLEQDIKRGGYNQPQVPEEYERVVESDSKKQKTAEIMVSGIPKTIHLKSGDVGLAESTVLDLGSGTGIITDKIKDQAGKVISLDQAEVMVSHLKKRFSENQNVEPVVGDMVKMPLADNAVEVIISAGAIKELPVIKDGKVKIEEIEGDFLKELMRVLKPGGICLLDSVRNAENDYVKRQFVRRRQAELKRYRPEDEGRIFQRENIFLAEDLKDEKGQLLAKGIGTRLGDLGYKCEVESLFDLEGNDQSAVVRITLLEK